MPKLNRTWSLQLQTNKEKFSKAFYDVVTKDNKFVLQIFSLANNINEDFFGSIANDNSTIWKRKGILDPHPTKSFTLKGEIVPNANSLTLNLELSNQFAFNYPVKRVVINVIITIILFFISRRMLWATHLFAGKMTPVYLFVPIPILFVLGYYLQTKIIQMYLDWLEDLYNKVLEQIERQSNLN
jgi:hypothetical protein